MLNQVGIRKLYEEYLKKVISGEVFPQSLNSMSNFNSHRSTNIFKAYFEQHEGQLSELEEKYLVSLLRKNVSKWFVAHVLNVVDNFSLNLMEEFINTGINENDPSYNSCFVYPAERVHKLRVNDYLLSRFSESSRNQKIGILRLFYWTNQYITKDQKIKKISILLKEYKYTKDKRLKIFLNSELPNKLEEYPISLRQEAKVNYFRD